MAHSVKARFSAGRGFGDATTLGRVQAPERLVDRNRRRARREIAETAARLFGERGYDAVSVEEIAAAAGISRRTFFRYFAAKDDVLFVGHDHGVERLRELLAVAPAGSAVPGELERLRGVLVEMFAVPPSDFDLRVHALVAAEPALQRREQSLARDFEQVIADHLRAHGHQTQRAALLAGACMGALNAARRLAGAGPLSADRLARLTDEAIRVLAEPWPDRP